MQFELVTTDGSDKTTEISEVEATRLLMEQYGHNTFLEDLKTGKASCASVRGGMLRASEKMSEKCPTCSSKYPAWHPAMQSGGEVETCFDPFHDAHLDVETIKSMRLKIERLQQELAQARKEISAYHNSRLELVLRAESAEAQVTELSAKVAVMALLAEKVTKLDGYICLLEYFKNDWEDIATTAREALSNLPEQSQKLLAVLRAAKAFSRLKVADEGDPTNEELDNANAAVQRLDEAVRALQGDEG